MDFSHYAEVPHTVREKIIAESGKKAHAEAEA
jgi:hypothetical protein